MLKTTTIVALALGAAATETTYPSNTVFTWDRNTNFGDARNWDHSDGETPTGNWGVVDLNVDCINDFGPNGGQVKVDESFTLSELNLPMNGEVILGEGSTITFEEGSTNVVSFKCSTRDTACSKNWKVSTANGQQMVTPDRPPCYEDIALINGVDGHMIDWHSNQHLSAVNLAMENAEIKSYSVDKSAEFAARFAALTSSWRGLAPIIGNPSLCGQSESCKLSCYDSCPPEADDIDGDLTEFFSEMDEKKADAKAKADRFDDALEFLKDAETTSKSALDKVIDDAVADYKTECNCESGTDQVTEQIDFSVSSQDMFDWMSQANINRRRSAVSKQSLRYASTFGSISSAFDFLNGADLTNVWTDVDPSETGTLTNPGVTEFFFGTGLESNGINNDLKRLGLSLSSGSVTASGANPGDEADHSQGKYVFENVNIVGDQQDNETDKVFFSPKALQLVASASVTKFQLWFVSKAANDEVKLFTAQIAARTAAPTGVPTSSAPTTSPSVSPTVSPSVSPSASPTLSPTAAELGLLEGTNGIMIYGGAGGGLVLIILIIVIACLLTKKGSSKANKPEEQRNVVAFENPMYDDPAATSQVNDAEEPGLYDEPSFNQGADKENPMYQSQENVEEEPSSGGYLDVQPDDEDDDDDEDEDEDEDDEDEDE